MAAKRPVAKTAKAQKPVAAAAAAGRRAAAAKTTPPSKSQTPAKSSAAVLDKKPSVSPPTKKSDKKKAPPEQVLPVELGIAGNLADTLTELSNLCLDCLQIAGIERSVARLNR